VENSTTDQWCLVFDNNLLRSITRIGNKDVAQKVFAFFDGEAYLNRRPNSWLISPANIIEFLGIKVDKIAFNFKNMEAEVRECISRPKFRYVEVSRIIDRHTELYEETLKATHIFSKKSLNSKLALQMGYTDESIKDNIQVAFDRATRKIYRDMMYNTVATERIQSYRWPVNLRPHLISAYTGEALYFNREKLNYNFVRFNSNFAFDFFDYFTMESNRGTKGGVSQEQIKENIEFLKKATLFKKDEDLMDTEAVSLACLGNFESGKRIRILFATQDPVDQIIMRVSFFKSIVSNLMNSFTSIRPGHQLDFFEGKIIIFNSKFDPAYVIDVSRIPPLGDELFNSNLSDIVKTYRDQFYVVT
jgi:hypothetical protein